jgi:hypothetical protein
MSPYGRRAIEARFPPMGAFGGLGATWHYKQAWRRRLCGPHLRRAVEDEVGIALGLADPAVPRPAKAGAFLPWIGGAVRGWGARFEGG